MFLNLPEDPDIPLDCLGLDLQVVEVLGEAPEVQQPPHHRPLLRRFVLANCKKIRKFNYERMKELRGMKKIHQELFLPAV